jgi:hypothetical protein
MTAVVADLDRDPHPHPHPHRRRRWPYVVSVCALVLACAIAAGGWLYVHRPGPRAVVSVTGPTASQSVTVTGGALTVGALITRLADSGHGQLLTASTDGTISLSADLIVGRRGTLTISGSSLVLRSDSVRSVKVSVRDGGTLSVDRSTVVSWGGSGVDSDLADGRASITATGAGSTLSVNRSNLSYLGEDVNNPGLSWRNGAVGSLIDSTLRYNFLGADASRSGILRISGSTFSSSTQQGLLLDSPASGSTVDSSTFDRNGAEGLLLRNAQATALRDVEASANEAAGLSVLGSSSVTVSGGQLSANKGEGLLLTNATAALVQNIQSWDNTSGVTVSGGNATINSSQLSGNTSDGVLVVGTDAQATLHGNRLDHNDRGGLWLTAGSAIATSNTFDRNDTGLRVDDTSTVTAKDNTFLANVIDAVALAVPVNPGITGNRISGSGQAVFSLPATGDLSAVEAANVVDSGQTLARVRGTTGS